MKFEFIQTIWKLLRERKENQFENYFHKDYFIQNIHSSNANLILLGSFFFVLKQVDSKKDLIERLILRSHIDHLVGIDLMV